jgi:hypothetical protein
MRHTNHTLKILICSLIIAAIPLFGEVKMQVREGRPIVDGVFVNGHGPYRFLLDTGANVNLIETGIARKIGMNAAFQMKLASIGKTTLAQGSDDNEIVLDSVRAEKQEFFFSELEAIHHLSPDIQGVLGQWFLSRFDYLLDLRGKHLEFGKQDRGGTRVPFRFVNARPLISTSLGELALDSGAGQFVLFGAPPAGMSADNQLLSMAGSQQVGMVPSQRLAIGDLKIWTGATVAIPGRPEPEVDGLLPARLFQSIFVSNSERYLVLR